MWYNEYMALAKQTSVTEDRLLEPGALSSFGVALLGQLLDNSELSAAREEASRVVTVSSTASVQTWVESCFGDAQIEQIDALLDISPEFSRLASRRDVVERLDELVPGPKRLFRSKLVLKQPGHPGYGLHQDQAWWTQAEVSKTFTLGISLDDTTSEAGPVEFFLGSHLRLLTARETPRLLEVSEVTCSTQRYTAMLRAGDAVLFSGLAVHRSGPNLSSFSRRMVYFSYALKDAPAVDADVI
jgi:ectoine hydroxylase-related dioxygenase (phytanoyl-CoA dioxygenase family)